MACLMKHNIKNSGGGVTARILNFGVGWSWLVSFMFLLLYSWRKNPQYSLNMRLDGPQSPSRCFGEERSLVPVLESIP